MGLFFSKHNFFPFIALVLVSVISALPVYAEGPSASNVLVKVRAIRAAHPISENEKDIRIKVDPRLADIRENLRSFDFRSFRMVSNQEKSVPLRKKDSMYLTERTVLNFRPVYSEDERVGIWIKWTDLESSQVLLDTRMHFNSSENMLTGTNCRNNRALILAISAKPDR